MMAHLLIMLPAEIDEHKDWDIISDSVYQTVSKLSETPLLTHELVEAAVEDVLDMASYGEDYSEKDKYDIADVVLDVFNKPENQPSVRFITALNNYPSLTYLTSSKKTLSFLLETNEDVC